MTTFKHYFERDDWDKNSLTRLEKIFSEADSEYTINAAIGEGAGGHGFETVIHFVLASAASGVIGNAAYGVLKKLVRRLQQIRPRPKNTPAEVKNIKQAYRLLVYTPKTVVSIDLDGDIDQIEIAVDKLPIELRKPTFRLDQEGSEWRRYD